MFKLIEKIRVRLLALFRVFRFNTVYIGNNLLLAQTIHRTRLYIFADDLSVTPEIIENGAWEPGITKVFKYFAKRSKVILEIGANVGYYTTLGRLNQKFDDSLYIAVEANPETFTLLKNNIEINGLVKKTRLINKAFCGESREYVDFYIPKFHTPSSSITKPLVDDDYKKIQIQTISTKDLLGGLQYLDLIKIDAEGCEHKIISSLISFCRLGTVIIFEYFPNMILQNGNKPGDLIKLLEDNNFDIKKINKNGRKSSFNGNIEINDHIELIAIKIK